MKNVTASVKARLLQQSKHQPYSFQQIIQYYAIERFLYRLRRRCIREEAD